MLTKSELMGESTSPLLTALKLAHTLNVGSMDHSLSYEMSFVLPVRLLAQSTIPGCNLTVEVSFVTIVWQLSLTILDELKVPRLSVRDHSHHGWSSGQRRISLLVSAAIDDDEDVEAAKANSKFSEISHSIC